VWECTKCREAVEDTFDVCWNCGTSKDGLEDPAFQKADASGAAPTTGAKGVVQAAAPAGGGTGEQANLVCKRCGSNRIIPSVSLLDHYGDMGVLSDEAKVQVHGAPRAWIFRDAAEGSVSLEVCGECGHAEVRVTNARELWEKYQRSRQE
jgi:hypothetical protein